MNRDDGSTAEALEFRASLAPGMAWPYAEFHRAIPADLDAVMRAAGVRSWQIFLNGNVLTHRVTTGSRERLRELLDPHPVNLAWQRQIAPYLTAGQPAEAPGGPGALIWDFSWPTR